MKKIREKYYLLLVLVFGYVFSYTNVETGWQYVQTTGQTFYMFENINIDDVNGFGDGQSPATDDGQCYTNPYTCDIIGAFVSRDENIYGDLNDDGQISSSVDVCVGYNYVNSDTTFSFGFTTIATMGRDTDEIGDPGYEYLVDGEAPFFKVYDHVNEIILPLETLNAYYTEFLTDLNGNGEWDDIVDAEPFDDVNGNDQWDGDVYNEILGYSNLAFYTIYGSVDGYNTLGCNNEDACNYDSEVTADDGSCILPPSGEITIDTTVDGNSFILSFDDSNLEGSGEFSHQVIVSQGFTELYNEVDADSPIELIDLNWSTTYSIEIITTNFDICESLPNSQYPLYTNDIVQTEAVPAPGQVVLSTPVEGEGQIFLNWESVDFASIYRIFSNETLIDSIDSTMDDISYVDTQLAPDSTYIYQVQAVNIEGGVGPISDSVSATTIALSTVTLDSVSTGQGQLQLAWSMEDYQYGNANYFFDIYIDDEFLTSRYGTSYIVSNLDADVEYCFYIVSAIDLLVDGESLEFISNQSNTLCGTPEAVSGWSVLIEAEFNILSQPNNWAFDIYNELGMTPEATDDYDAELDIPEPFTNPSEWISFSFYHPEWNQGFGDDEVDYYTTDIRELKDLSKSLEIWDANIIADNAGNGSLSFDFISNAGNYPVYLNRSNQYDRVYDGGTIDFIYNTPEVRDSLRFVIGNQPPATPTSLLVTGESRILNLEWDLNLDCTDEGVSCNEYKNRYPATSYKIYRHWYEENLPHIIGLAGTRHHRISIFPSELYAETDNLFSITQNPADGYLEAEYFENFIDLNLNEIHDQGEDFIDCGWDGLCFGDPGYESEEYSDENEDGEYNLGEAFEDYNLNGIWDENGPDIGEADGICNTVYYYQANSYLSEGLDSLSYSNGVYDYGEEFVDDNGNQEWDEGESYTDSRQLMIKISDQLESEYQDTGLRTGTIYFYNVLASNDAGDSNLSIMDSEETAPNIRPIADAGVDQIKYLTPNDGDSMLCTLPLDNIDLNGDGYFDEDEYGNPMLDVINNSYDPDALDGEQLLYFWELYDPENSLDFIPQQASGDGWWEIGSEEIIDLTLPETDYYPSENYLVRLYVQDVSGYYSIPDSMTIQVTTNIPVPAKVTNLIAEESLYYIHLEWDESTYDPPGGMNPPPEGYDGDLDIAEYYVIYRDSIEHHIVSDSLFFIDNQLTPQEEYTDENGNGFWDEGEPFTDDNGNGECDSKEEHCYYIVAMNDTEDDIGYGSGASIPSNEQCYSTGELPIPIISSPSGGEILISGDQMTIEWNSFESNAQYIDSVKIYHSIDAGENWNVIPGGSWSSSEEIPEIFDFNVIETDTILFYNKFKVEVSDIGDYGGVAQAIHTDITDHLIIIASEQLENNYNAGWNIISSPLQLDSDSTDVWDNFDVDNFTFNLYSQSGEVSGSDPEYQDAPFEFQIEEGFYMASEEEVLLSLNGTVLTETETLNLNSGWNLIGNPFVARIMIDYLQVEHPTATDLADDPIILSWSEATDSMGLLLPTIHGYDNDAQMHVPINILEPFSGYWIHASEPLKLLITPHVYDESFYNRDRDDEFQLTLYSQEHDSNLGPLLWKDMIRIGLSSTASDSMVYGEDEYDIPVNIVTAPSFSDIWIDQPDWYEAGAERREFCSETRSIVGSDRIWNLKGILRGNEAPADIYLNWSFEHLELIGDDDVSLLVGQEIVDMRENSFVVIDRTYFGNMQIIIGDIPEPTCEDDGLVTCLDGSCAESFEECSCESQGLISCEDGECVENEEDCGELSNEIPDKFSISVPYPNPFNPTVKFDFSLPSIDQVDVNVYDINGMHVATLVDEVKPAGYYSVIWNANHQATGMYFIQFSSKEMIKTMKVVLIK